MSLRVTHYLPGCADAAVKPLEYQLDTQALRMRAIFGYALSWVSMAALYWACPPLGLLASKGGILGFAAIALLPTVPALLETYRGYKALNQRAIDAFLNEGQDLTEETIKHLASNAIAYRELSEKKEGFGKDIQDRFSTLQDRVFSKDGSCLSRWQIIRQTTDVFQKDTANRSLFLRATEYGDLDDLDKVLKKHYRLQDRSPSQRISSLVISSFFRLIAHVIGSRFTISSSSDQKNVLSIKILIELVKHIRHPHVLTWFCKHFYVNSAETDSSSARSNEPSESFLEHFIGNGIAKNIDLLIAGVQEGLRTDFLLQRDPQSGATFEDREALFLLRQLINQKNSAETSLSSHNVEDLSRLAASQRKGLGQLAIVLPLMVPIYAAWASSVPQMLPTLTWSRGLALTALMAGVGYVADKNLRRLSLVEATFQFLTSSIPDPIAMHKIASDPKSAELLGSRSLIGEIVNKLDSKGNTLIGLAVDYGNFDLFQKLLELGACPLHGRSKSAFFRAVRSKDPRFLLAISNPENGPQFALPNEYHIEMWLSIGSLENAVRLIQEFRLSPGVAFLYLSQNKAMPGRLEKAKMLINMIPRLDEIARDMNGDQYSLKTEILKIVNEDQEIVNLIVPSAP